MSLVVRLMFAVALALLSASSWAQLSYFTLVDSDNDTTTGCNVTLPTSGTVAGIERRLTATVSETAAPQVTQLALESCVGDSFGAPVALPGAPYPVGSNNGTGGADAVEQAVSASAIAALGAPVRLYFAAQGPTSDDLLGSANGPPVLFGIQPGGGAADIPFLSGWGSLALASFLLIVVFRHRSRLPANVVGVLLVGMLAGIAWAAGFRLDGQVNDWQGVSAVGSDAQGDSASNTDIVAAFAAQEGGNLFFRIDIENAETSPLSNQAPSFISTAITTANVASPYSYAVTTNDPDGDALTLTAPTLPAWLTLAPGANGAGTLSGAPSPADAGPHAVVLRVTDNGTPSRSTDQSFTITVGAAANPAPVLDLNGPAAGIDFAATFTEGGSAVAIVDPINLAVSDPDSLNLASATVTLTNLLDAGQETLAVNPATVAPNTPITAAFNAATGELTFAGSATLAQYQAALRTVTYNNAAAAPTATPARVITFVVSDGSNSSVPATATVTVASVNDAPSFTAANPPAVNEDSGPQTVNGWVTAFDPGPADEAAQTAFAYTVSNVSNAALFSTPPSVNASGNLSYTPAPDAFGTSTFEVRVQDSGGTANGGQDTSAPQTFTITVNGINDQPSFTASAPPTVAEDAGPQTVPGWATFNPGNAQESAQTALAYTVSNVSNAALFSVQPSVAANGNLTYTPAAGANGTSTFGVAVQDSGGTANGGVDASASQSFTITVNAVDDPPTAVNDTANLVEDAAATTINVLANDTDSDGGPIGITAVTQPASGTVVIAGGGTGLTYQPNADYCNAPPGTTLDTFTYDLTPGGSTATVTVTVNCVNDGPVLDLDANDNQGTGGSDFAATFTEGNPATLIEDPADATVTDVDNTTLASMTVTITNLLDTGVETLAANMAGTSITANYVAATGVLTLTGPDTIANFQTVLRTVTYNNTSPNPDTTARIIQFVASDGATNSATATSTVTVNAVNTAPSFTVGPNQTVNQNAGARTVNPWATVIGDGDDNTQTLTFNITGNTDPSLFTAGPAVSSAGVLTYTPSTSANGTATITVTLSDDGSNTPPNVNTSAAQTFTITVNAVNDAPSFTAGPNQTVLEDAGAQTVAGWATSISAGPPDEAGQTVTFNITGNTNPGLFSAGPAISPAGVLTYTPAANANGGATITVTLSDNGSNTPPNVNTSAAQMFTITVTSVNDAPSFTPGGNQTVNEDAPAQSVAWATAIDDGDPELTQTLTFNVSNDNNALFSAQPAINPAGTLTYTPAANANGSATVSVTLQDSGDTANGGDNDAGPVTFTITVTAVNDPPVAQNKTANAQANMKITGLSGLLTGVTDPDTGTGSPACNPTFTVGTVGPTTNPAGGTISNVDVNAGTFDFDPPPGVTGSVTFNYTVVDSGCPSSATSAPATITVNVSGPVIWFVDANVAGPGDGRLSNPFKNLTGATSADAVDAANQRIFVFSGTYASGITLNSGEWLIGQGVSGASFDAVFGITPPLGTIARPSIGGTRPTLQNTVTMDTNSQVKGLNIASTTNTGITASGKTGLVTGEVSVTTTTGAAANFANSGGTLSFTSISANGGTNGIVLNTTTGSFTVTGNSSGLCGGSVGSGPPASAATTTAPVTSDCTGGTIQNTTGPAILLNTASNVSLTRIQVLSSGDDGVQGTNVTGFALVSSFLDNNGNALNENSIDFGDSSSVTPNGLHGTGSITNSTIRNAYHRNVAIRNLDGVALTAFSITGSQFRQNPSNGDADDNILMEALGTANMALSVTGSHFSSTEGDHIQTAGVNSGTLNVNITNNTFTGGHSTPLGQGITINAATGVAFGGWSGRIDYDVNGNNIQSATSNGVSVVLGTSSAAAVFDGFIRNNVIGTTGQPLSCSTQANGIAVDAHGNGTHTVAVTNNTIRRCADYGMFVLANDGNGALNLTVTGNTVTEMLDDNTTNGTPREAIHLNLGATSTNVFGQIDSHAVCLALGGAGVLANNLTGGSFKNGDIRLRQRFRTSVVLPGYTPPGGNNFDTASVIAFLLGNNTGGGTATAATNNDATFTGEGYFGGAACTLPSP